MRSLHACPHCGKPISRDALSCIHCGESPARQCGICKKPLKRDEGTHTAHWDCAARLFHEIRCFSCRAVVLESGKFDLREQLQNGFQALSGACPNCGEPDPAHTYGNCHACGLPIFESIHRMVSKHTGLSNNLFHKECRPSSWAGLSLWLVAVVFVGSIAWLILR